MLEIQALTIIGFALSLYAIYVRYRARDPKYKAVCELGEKANCKKVLTSDYGVTLGVPNGFWGLIFYGFFFATTLYDTGVCQLCLALLAALLSVPLAYYQFSKLQTFCVVCFTIYLVNIALVYFTYVNYV